jgi:glycosyltransferase involved in cell wall biosynthesis
MRRLRHLLLATLEDPFDPLSWSGTTFALRESLSRQVETLTVLGPLRPKRTPHHAALRVLFGGTPPRYPLWMTPPALKDFARTVHGAVSGHEPDAILSISSQCLVFLEKPVNATLAMFGDAPWLAWKQAYARYERMPIGGAAFAKREAIAARKCDALFFASSWAVNEAQHLYGVSPERLNVAPLGASWVPQMDDAELLQRVRSRDTALLRLLFVGKDWERKGGPLALDIARELHAGGQPTRLDIVGASPVLPEDARNFSRVHGPLRRSQPEEAAKLRQLFLQAHFLVVPTDAECFGIVFAEAFAHALPAVSRNVHAVPSIIDDGVNGILEDRAANASAYARRIREVFVNPARYESMAAAGRAKYKCRFTWDACASTIVSVLESLPRTPQ